MAMLMKSKGGLALRRSAPVASARVVSVRAAAERPVWYPGNPPPAHLDGT